MNTLETAPYKLAEVNLRLLHPNVDPSGVTDFEDRMNPLLDAAGAVRGFRGLIVPEEGDWPLEGVTAGRPHALNITVWESLTAIGGFMKGNREVIRCIRQYEHLYEETNLESLAFWWEQLKPGVVPTIHEAIGRLQQLRSNGPTEQAFNFATRGNFPKPGLDFATIRV